MSEELSDKIIERIDVEKIAPLSRWRFILWRGLLGLFAVLSVVIGGIAVGVIIFLISGLYLTGLLAIPHDLVEYLLMVPYLWLLILIVFVLIARASIKHTKKGYRYSLSSIILTSVILSVVLGFIFYFSGIGKETHEFLNRIPLYDSAVHDTNEAWEFHMMRLPHN